MVTDDPTKKYPPSEDYLTRSNLEEILPQINQRFDQLEKDLAREKETVPYCVRLIGNRPLTSEEVAYGLSLESLAKECLGR